MCSNNKGSVYEVLPRAGPVEVLCVRGSKRPDKKRGWDGGAVVVQRYSARISWAGTRSEPAWALSVGFTSLRQNTQPRARDPGAFAGETLPRKY